MANLTPQTMSLILSLLGIVVLLACLLLIGLRRVPELSAPQKLKGFGMDLNVSIVTLLVLVGLVLSLTSTFLQVKNYDSELASAKQKATGLEVALSQARKMNVNAHITFEGVTTPEDIKLEDLQCKYYIDNPDGNPSAVDAKLAPSLYGLDFIVTLEDISPRSRIDLIEVIDKNPEHRRKWLKKDIGYVLTPKFDLQLVR